MGQLTKKSLDSIGCPARVKDIERGTDIQRELESASRLFSPEKTDLEIKPIRILWEIVGTGISSAGVAALSGGKPVIGAVTGSLSQLGRSLPAFTHEFGAMLFGRGAFDLARRVRRAVSDVELRAL